MKTEQLRSVFWELCNGPSEYIRGACDMPKWRLGCVAALPRSFRVAICAWNSAYSRLSDLEAPLRTKRSATVVAPSRLSFKKLSGARFTPILESKHWIPSPSFFIPTEAGKTVPSSDRRGSPQDKEKR